MLFGKRFEQKVTINDRRRENKKKSDILSKGADPRSIHRIFNAYYRDQVSALYKAICQDR